MDSETFNIIMVSLAMSAQAGHISIAEYKQASDALVKLVN